VIVATEALTKTISCSEHFDGGGHHLASKYTESG